jgi:hypothetical protein
MPIFADFPAVFAGMKIEMNAEKTFRAPQSNRKLAKAFHKTLDFNALTFFTSSA